MAVITADDEQGRQSFASWATRAEAWARHANALRDSSELLWTPIQQMFAVNNAPENRGSEQAERALLSASHAYAYLLIAGAALETMLKAAAIQVALNAKGHAGVMAPSGVELQQWLTTHKLESLVKRLGIDCDEVERDHVERFAKYIEWAGRYPTPKTEAKNTAGATPYIVSDFDRHMFLTLFRKAEAAFHSATMHAKPTAGKDAQ